MQDVTKLTPLSPEVISRQATINIGKKKISRRGSRGHVNVVLPGARMLMYGIYVEKKIRNLYLYTAI